MQPERSWDEISEFYEMYASRTGWEGNFGKGMLDIIQSLRNDPETKDMYPGTAMTWLLVAMPNNDECSIHIGWVSDNTYKIF